MKNELLQVTFEPATLCIPDRCSYQMSYMYIQVVLLNFFKHLLPFFLSFHLKSSVFGKLIWLRTSYLALHSYILHVYMYTCSILNSFSQELNIEPNEVESLLVSCTCILDGTIIGKIDQVQQILVLDTAPQGSARYDHYL